MPKNILALFLREAERRRNYMKFYSQKMSEMLLFEETTKYVYDVSETNLYDIKYLINLTSNI